MLSRNWFDQPDPLEGSYSLADPQSFNRYAYTQNDPVNFSDPSGLFSIANPIEVGGLGTVTVTDSFDSFAGFNAWEGGPPETVPGGLPEGYGIDDIGGIDIGDWTPPVITGTTQQNPPPAPTPRQDFKNFLQTMSQDCKDALNGLPGNILGKLSNLANTAQVYDVNQLQNARASKYVDGKARGRETLGQWFDRQGHDAYTAVGVPRPGIYIRGGESAFFAGAMYFQLHEMTHLAYPFGGNLDRSLGLALHLTKGANESWSNAVSRFFNSQCTKKGP